MTDIIDAHHHIWRRRDLPWLDGPMQPRIFGPYEAIRRDYLIDEYLADLAGTGVTVNSLLPGGACDTDPDRVKRPGQTLLPVDIMNPVVVWLASDLSDGKTGGRYVGKLWDGSLPPDQAAAKVTALRQLLVKKQQRAEK